MRHRLPVERIPGCLIDAGGRRAGSMVAKIVTDHPPASERHACFKAWLKSDPETDKLDFYW